jgi:hypothetical protein
VFKKRGLDNATVSMKPTGCYKRSIFSKTPENQDPAKDVRMASEQQQVEIEFRLLMNLLAFIG